MSFTLQVLTTKSRQPRTEVFIEVEFVLYYAFRRLIVFDVLVVEGAKEEERFYELMDTGVKSEGTLILDEFVNLQFDAEREGFLKVEAEILCPSREAIQKQLSTIESPSKVMAHLLTALFAPVS